MNTFQEHRPCRHCGAPIRSPGWIRGLRILRGLTLKQVAEEAGMTYQDVSAIEHGRNLSERATIRVWDAIIRLSRGGTS